MTRILEVTPEGDFAACLRWDDRITRADMLRLIRNFRVALDVAEVRMKGD